MLPCTWESSASQHPGRMPWPRSCPASEPDACSEQAQMQVCARQADLSRIRRHKTCVFPHLPGICFRSHTRLRDGSQKGERQRETWVCYLWFRVVDGCLTLICQGLVVGEQGRARRGSGTKSTLLIVMPNKKKNRSSFIEEKIDYCFPWQRGKRRNTRKNL